MAQSLFPASNQSFLLQSSFHKNSVRHNPSSASVLSVSPHSKSIRMQFNNPKESRMEKKSSLKNDALVSSDKSALTEENYHTHTHLLNEQKEFGLSTQILHFKAENDPYGAVSTPIYQTATFRQPSATENGVYDYTRSGNPTREALEKLLAKVENADRAFVFTSGMAAITVVTQLLQPGEEILAGDDIYGGTDRLISKIVSKMGITIKRVDTSDINQIKREITKNTKLIIMESPTNPRIIISDIKSIADIAHENNALLMVDNSIMSPVLSQPLSLGADIVMHSATKFISGHSDIMAGVLAVNGKKLGDDVYFLQNAQGNALAPFDSWLCLRGIKTMKLRVEKQQENAQKIAEFLSTHEKIKKVNYVGLPNHPNRQLHFSQSKGAGSVLSFNTHSLAASKHIVENMKLANITVSFGGVSTSISLPCFMSHASIPSSVREERGLTEDLVRLSVGIEDVDDLIADLDQALSSAP